MKIPIGPLLLEIIRLAYQAKRPVILEGPTGVGKSELFAEAARTIDGGIDFRTIDLSILEPPDLVGIPRISDNNRTTYAIPDFWPNSGKGILFFDELNRASTALLNPALQILTTRQIHGHPLPQGWIPMAAMNPASESDYHGTNALDRALLARFSVIQVTAEVSAWLSWAKRSDVHSTVIAYIEADPAAFLGKHSNPRAWAYVSDLMHSFDKGGFSLDALMASVAGFVGDALAFAFLATVQNPGALDVPDANELLAVYNADNKSALRRLTASGDTAKIMKFTHGIMMVLQHPEREDEVKKSSKRLNNLRKIIADLPAEFRDSVIESSPWIIDKGESA